MIKVGLKIMIGAALALTPVIAIADEPESEPRTEAANAVAEIQEDVDAGETDKIASVTKVIGALGSAAYVVEKGRGPVSDAKKDGRRVGSESRKAETARRRKASCS